MFTILAIYLGLGVLVGLLAGLLGIGGGLVVVPMVSFSLTYLGYTGEIVHHMALGTSFSTIVFTSISSFISHNRLGNVLWKTVFRITPGIVAGVIIGGVVAAHLSSAYLQIFFVCFLIYVAVQMFVNAKPKGAREIPGLLGCSAVGGGIGFISSLVGIGGGTITIPFLLWCNAPMRKTIGTSAAVGMPIALMGALVYIYTGWNDPALPAYSLGFVFLPAMLGISLASVLTAPLGAALSRRLPVPLLKKIFAIMILGVGARMIWVLL